VLNAITPSPLSKDHLPLRKRRFRFIQMNLILLGEGLLGDYKGKIKSSKNVKNQL
jgi:hypothetical protein